MKEKYLYLMIKRCTVNNKKYLCKRLARNDAAAINYRGSGLHVLRLRKKYGNDCMVHDSIICKLPQSRIDEFNEICLQKSNELNIVESTDWLNMVPETGGGGSTAATSHTKGRKVMFKGRERKYVKPEEIEEFEADGWALGIPEWEREARSKRSKGRTAWNKGIKMKEPHEYATPRGHDGKPVYVRKFATAEELSEFKRAKQIKLNSTQKMKDLLAAPRKPPMTVRDPDGNIKEMYWKDLVAIGVSIPWLRKGKISKGYTLIKDNR